ncbi:MAG: TrmH family RNA methyltransferase [Eubacteriales bacterium]|nr:TrmH family RNA methyltransferase [Eubacteriales bacterium]
MPTLKKYTRKLNYSYAPGLFASIEALKNKPESVQRILISTKLEDQLLEKLLTLCKEKNIRMEQADKALSRISQKENCLAAAVFEKTQHIDNSESRHLILHHPQDMGNVGTILRTALGFGFLDIAIITPAADVFDPRVVRASMGAHFSLNIKEYESFEEYKSENSERIFYPFMLDGATALEDACAHKKEPFALIFGNEGSGLPKEFSHIGKAVKIPHSDKIDSLNLAIAAAIAMYGFTR